MKKIILSIAVVLSLISQNLNANTANDFNISIGKWVNKRIHDGYDKMSEKFDKLMDAFVEGLGKAFTDNLNKFLFNNYFVPRFVRWWGQKVPPYQYDKAQTFFYYPMTISDLILDFDTKIQVEAFTKSLKLAEESNAPLPKMLLYGAPGVGKTQIARAIVNEGKFIMKSFTGGELSRLTHDQLQHIMNYINSPYDRKIILFIDEAETFFKESYGRRTPQLQAFMAATGARSPNFTVIAATNFAEQFDEAAFQRFDYKVHIHLPQAKQRLDIFSYYVDRNLKKSSKDLSFNLFSDDMAFKADFLKATDGLSPRDLEQLAELIVAETDYFEGIFSPSRIIYRIEDLKQKKSELLSAKETADRRRREDMRSAYFEKKLAEEWGIGDDSSPVSNEKELASSLN